MEEESVPDRGRTYNLRLRRPTLCPIELREHAERYCRCGGPFVQRTGDGSTWATRGVIDALACATCSTSRAARWRRQVQLRQSDSSRSSWECRFCDTAAAC